MNLGSVVTISNPSSSGVTVPESAAPASLSPLRSRLEASQPALLAAGTGASTEEGMICVTIAFLEGTSTSVRGVSGALQARFEQLERVA